jgi:electron transfer flavoprotein alpha subunit
MAEIIVFAEHRAGQMQEITLQMLSKASELCRAQGYKLSVALLCDAADTLLPSLEGRADEIVAYEAPRFAHFDPDACAEILVALVQERKPLLLLLGHTAWSMDLAAALATKTGYPLATDCVDILLDAGDPKVVRQVYNGKMLTRSSFRPADGYLVTVRPGSFSVSAGQDRRTTVNYPPVPALSSTARRRFVAYRDTGKGEVDITQAEVLVSVGRGIGDGENIEPAREVAALLGGALSCSRPVVDKKWLPKYHQVGTSGKSVTPKIYLALGISGAFQHMAGIAGAGTVIAVNKDKKAPIFRAADYGAVADALDIVTALKTELRKN